jgi:membrane-bound lytic murein transglycosylase B
VGGGGRAHEGRGQPAHARAQASIIIPQGRNGPAFIAYPNFNVLFEWNQSFTYVLTAAYFATRLEGAPVIDTRNPAPRARRQLHAGAAAAFAGAGI